jgi:hypothetical protein
VGVEGKYKPRHILLNSHVVNNYQKSNRQRKGFWGLCIIKEVKLEMPAAAFCVKETEFAMALPDEFLKKVKLCEL